MPFEQLPSYQLDLTAHQYTCYLTGTCSATGDRLAPAASSFRLALGAEGPSRAGDGSAIEGDAGGLQGLAGEDLVGEGSGSAGRTPSSKPMTAHA